jgi:CheY-like chemotaxis protein
MGSPVPKHVLIVEDDQFILESLQELLADEGYRVSTAANGQLALDELRRMDPLPDLILLDLMMPVLDGVGFRRAQLADTRLAAIPVVLLSADGQIESKKAGLGLEHAVKKPVDIETIFEIVRRFCG